MTNPNLKFHSVEKRHHLNILPSHTGSITYSGTPLYKDTSDNEDTSLLRTPFSTQEQFLHSGHLTNNIDQIIGVQIRGVPLYYAK